MLPKRAPAAWMSELSACHSSESFQLKSLNSSCSAARPCEGTALLIGTKYMLQGFTFTYEQVWGVIQIGPYFMRPGSQDGLCVWRLGLHKHEHAARKAAVRALCSCVGGLPGVVAAAQRRHHRAPGPQLLARHQAARDRLVRGLLDGIEISVRSRH